MPTRESHEAMLKAEVVFLRNDMDRVKKALFEGNGNPSVLTRLAIGEQKDKARDEDDDNDNSTKLVWLAGIIHLMGIIFQMYMAFRHS